MSHGQALVQLTADVNLPVAIENGEFEELGHRMQAVLPYVGKLTLRPSEMTEEDLGPLREAGLSDEDILDVVMIASYYGYINRIVDALGVRLSAEQEKRQEEIALSRSRG